MAEIWNIPGRQRPRFWARQVRGLLLVVVFAVGLAATSLLTWLGSYGGKAVAVALAKLAAAATVNVGLFLLAFRVLTPQQVPTRQLLAGALVAGSPGRPYRPSVAPWSALPAPYQPGVRGVRDRPWPAVLVDLGARPTLYAAEVNVVAARQLWPRSLRQPPSTNTDQPAPVDLANQQQPRP